MFRACCRVLPQGKFVFPDRRAAALLGGLFQSQIPHSNSQDVVSALVVGRDTDAKKGSLMKKARPIFEGNNDVTIASLGRLLGVA